jgi:hypothetical protein
MAETHENPQANPENAVTETQEMSAKDKKRERLRKIRRRKGPSKFYFDRTHELACAEYARSTNWDERNAIFTKTIYSGFMEIIENLVNTYGFGYLPNIQEKKRECVAHAANKLEKFNPDKGRAFSWFSVIIKNWFLIQIQKFGKERKQDVSLDEIISNSLNELGESGSAQMMTQSGIDVQYERREFVQHFLIEFRQWKEDFRDNTNLMAVFDHIEKLFDGDFIELNGFDRKAIYEYMQTNTNLTSNQIANALYRLRKQYKEFRRNWYQRP